ncbi:hypothetical protein I3842_05G057300 [Carya illinoinensis]|uniref:Cupin type-1 domain-containing protein n=1 Tax=Carya illinoinensis TaxID=32201 RepID=A0A922F1Q5_CARIL|nr:hypothetical protein I3842_05G057300 [Carya illinoinensis]
MKGVPKCLVTVSLLALALSLASAYDPGPLQDFCIALYSSASAITLYFFLSTIFVNGKFCKNSKLVDVNDFFFSRLNMPGNTSKPLGSKVTLVTMEELVGLNTLGIFLARIDFAPYCLNPSHTNPHGIEILVVLEGTLYIGFVTSNADNNHLFTEVLNARDVFVFSIGLSNQYPRVITISKAVFGSKPPINPDVLAKAFQVDKNVVNYL